MSDERIEVVRLRGDFSFVNVHELCALLKPVIAAECVIIDFSDVDLFDARSIGLLLQFSKKRAVMNLAPERLSGLSAPLQKTFHLLLLDQIWPLYANMSSARSFLTAVCSG